jgi:hypothetical protein
MFVVLLAVHDSYTGLQCDMQYCLWCLQGRLTTETSVLVMPGKNQSECTRNSPDMFDQYKCPSAKHRSSTNCCNCKHRDVLSGVDYLVSQGWVDEARMGCMGWCDSARAQKVKVYRVSKIKISASLACALHPIVWFVPEQESRWIYFGLSHDVIRSFCSNLRWWCVLTSANSHSALVL